MGTSPSSSKTEPYASFNKLARRAKRYDPIEKEDLMEMYRQIEALIFSGVDYLLYNTTYVEDNICYLLAEIQTGLIKARKSYKGKRTQDKIIVGQDIEVGAENRRIFGIGFDIFKLSQVDRMVAAPHVRKIIRLMRLNNNFFENVLTTFQSDTEEYCSLVESLAEVHTTFDDSALTRKKKDPNIVKTVMEISDLMDQILLAELSAGTVHPQALYGTVRQIRSVVKKVKVLQEKIFRAYLRTILKPVREKARTEAEALDLYQSASFGLARAVSLYDHRSGVNFSTYAKHWIKQKIRGSTKKSSGPMIRLPGSVWDLNQKIQAAKRELDSDPGLRYTYGPEQISNKLGISVKSLEKVMEKIELAKTGSLDDLIRKQDGLDSELNRDSTLQDRAIEEEAYQEQAISRLTSILKWIDKDSQKLVCLHHGIMEGIENNPDRQQMLREIFRQLACKALIHKRKAMNAESIVVLSLPERIV